MHSENITGNPIGHEIWLLLKWLKLLGNCPIEPPHVLRIPSQRTKKGSNAVKASESWSNSAYRFYSGVSASAIFNVIVTCSYLVFTGSYILEAVFDCPVFSLRQNSLVLKFISSSDSNTSSYTDAQIKLISISANFLTKGFMQVFLIIETVFAWTTAADLIKFLNEWSVFTRLFDQCFRKINITVHSGLVPNIRKTRMKLLLRLGVVPIVTILPFFVYVNLVSKRLSYPTLVTLGLQLFPRRFIEEAKFLLMFSVLRESYAQIKYGIAMSATKQAKIDASEVQLWKRLIISTRNQCGLASKIQQNIEMVLSFCSIVAITNLVFIIINYSSLESNGRSFAFLGLSICFTISLLVRIYAKSFMAENITYQEQKLGNLICELSAETDPSDIQLQLQLQQIYSLIQQSPITITLGSYGTLNKRLVLTVIGQVVTYLIILLQLSNSVNA